MPLNNNILTVPFTKIAANGRGDLQRALGSSLRSMAALMTQVDTNKWAKYQPFVSGAIYGDRYSDRDSQRLAGLRAANWGWGMNGIPSYSNFTVLRAALAAGVTPGDVWKRVRPGAGDILRAMDFDGYATKTKLAQEWGPLGVDGTNGQMLRFPFGGLVSLSSKGTTVSSADTVTFSMDAADPDVDATGLLYLGDFAKMTDYNPTSYYNYTDWYLGLLLVPIAGVATATAFYILSVPNRLSEFGTSNVPGLRGVPFVLSASKANLPNGKYRLYPVLTQDIRNDEGAYFVQLDTSWQSEDYAPGRMVLLDGYRMDITVDNSLPVFNVSIAFSGTAFAITFRNNMSSPITFAADRLFCYVQTEYDFDNTPQDALVTARNDWYAAVDREYGDISSGGVVFARHFNLYPLFTEANGGSRVLEAGASVTFSLNTGDSFNGHPYDLYSAIDIFVQTTINGVSNRHVY